MQAVQVSINFLKLISKLKRVKVTLSVCYIVQVVEYSRFQLKQRVFSLKLLKTGYTEILLTMGKTDHTIQKPIFSHFADIKSQMQKRISVNQHNWHAIMFHGNLTSFIQLFACIFLHCHCVLIQSAELPQQKVTPNLNLNKTEEEHGRSATSHELQVVTLIGLSVSIICHILLLLTYGFFQELRNVSGSNLMNLSSSMCLSQILWLVGNPRFEGTIVCEVIAIFQHLLMQASFLAMSVISWHNYHVFSQPFAGRIANRARSKSIKYSAFNWIISAIFVAISVILDKTETFLVDYGPNCWLGTANARLYLFLLPLAMNLLFSIYKFIQTAVCLSRQDKYRRTVLHKEGKQNLLVCTKLATLVGFPWVFSFFGVLFPDVEALEYLFIVCVCIQGVCIALVFLFNKKILKLYKDWWNNSRKIDIGPTQNQVAIATIPPTRPTFHLP